jgi:hypothetical protein
MLAIAASRERLAKPFAHDPEITICRRLHSYVSNAWIERPDRMDSRQLRHFIAVYEQRGPNHMR